MFCGRRKAELHDEVAQRLGHSNSMNCDVKMIHITFGFDVRARAFLEARELFWSWMYWFELG